jgi:hydroxyacylglutathione hydrolase
MFFRMVYDDKLAQAAYVIGCQRTGEAVVIDPERDVDRYERVARENGLRITCVAETHIHADFLSGARELAEKGARVYLSDEGDADWKYQWPAAAPLNQGLAKYDVRLLKDGDGFKVGNIEVKAVHTPGHTPEHLCYMVTDRGGGADEPLGVVTGDFVFVGDVGRPDLLESAAGHAGNAAASARRLYRSVLQFQQWPDYLQLWPGHGAGSACGKALGAVPQSTVGYEKRFNSAVRAATSEGAFADEILAGQPEPPLYFARMKRDNKAGPPVLGGVPHPHELTPHELRALDPRKAAIIDTRPWAEFRTGHTPGALAFPMSKSFNTDVGSMVSEDEPIYLIIEPAGLDEAVRDLIRVGLDRIEGWFDAARISDRQRFGGSVEETPEVSAEEARRWVEGGEPFVLDVRRASEFAEGHIEKAANIAHTRLLSRLNEVPRDRPVLVHCRSGARSARATALLRRHGYNATNLAGGFLAWEAAAAS